MSGSSRSIDLAEFAKEHLFYEVQMFVYARDALKLVKSQSLEMNALTEVCVLHFRNLCGFFYFGTKPADVVAADYVNNWEECRPTLSPLLDMARIRANKELAHLTTRRIAGTPTEKDWNFDALSAALRPAIADFVRLVDKLKVSEGTISELQKI